MLYWDVWMLILSWACLMLWFVICLFCLWFIPYIRRWLVSSIKKEDVVNRDVYIYKMWFCCCYWLVLTKYLKIPQCFFPGGIGFNVHFNTFQVISRHCLLVTEGMVTWNITPQPQSYDIQRCHIIWAAGQPVFALNLYIFICRPYAFEKGASIANLKSLVWLARKGSTTRLTTLSCKS